MIETNHFSKLAPANPRPVACKGSDLLGTVARSRLELSQIGHAGGRQNARERDSARKSD